MVGCRYVAYNSNKCLNVCRSKGQLLLSCQLIQLLEYTVLKVKPSTTYASGWLAFFLHLQENFFGLKGKLNVDGQGLLLSLSLSLTSEQQEYKVPR